MAPTMTSPSVPLKVTSPTMPNSVGWRRCSGEATMPTIRIANREPRPKTTAPAAMAAAGSTAWVARYGTHKLETARAVAVSPDGARVYMTGISPRAETGSDAATLAYDAATGKRLWINRYAGPGDDGAWALAL